MTPRTASHSPLQSLCFTCPGNMVFARTKTGVPGRIAVIQLLHSQTKSCWHMILFPNSFEICHDSQDKACCLTNGIARIVPNSFEICHDSQDVACAGIGAESPLHPAPCSPCTVLALAHWRGACAGRRAAIGAWCSLARYSDLPTDRLWEAVI